MFCNFLHSQNNFNIDTSYTLKSTFNKELKNYPFIKIVTLQNMDSVFEIKDLEYTEYPRKLHLDAYCKKTMKCLPAVVLIHGGGWKSGNKNQMHCLAQSIASYGYCCFAIEYRLAPEAKYPAAIFDVKNAIKYIKSNSKKFNINPNKIAVLGCSSGGQIAALIGTTNQNLEFEDLINSNNENASINAIINIDGILSFNHPESKETNAARFWLDCDYKDNPKIWEQASSLNHIDECTSPILFINSDFTRFHAGRDDMINLLIKYKIYFELKTISNSPHSFWFFHPWFELLINYSVNFLDKIFK